VLSERKVMHLVTIVYAKKAYKVKENYKNKKTEVVKKAAP
jgi:hypothetical protein